MRPTKNQRQTQRRNPIHLLVGSIIPCLFFRLGAVNRNQSIFLLLNTLLKSIQADGLGKPTSPSSRVCDCSICMSSETHTMAHLRITCGRSGLLQSLREHLFQTCCNYWIALRFNRMTDLIGNLMCYDHQLNPTARKFDKNDLPFLIF